MNKAFQMNLGGVPFTIDDDAYRSMDAYLHQLETHFKHSDSRDEILSDIEARLAEIMTERLKHRDIITLEDVEHMITIMGNPNEFDDGYEPEPTRRRGGGTWDVKTGKKLFRDPDDQVIGGVCSGVAAYFGIQDPVWVRVGFAVVFFTMGFGLLLYLILWAVVPEAKTSGDRLSMMGEPANVQNIANMAERGIEDLSETIKDNWKEFKSKKKSNCHARANHMRHTNKNWLYVLTIPFRVLRYLIKSIVHIIRKIFGSKSRYHYERNHYV